MSRLLLYTCYKNIWLPPEVFAPAGEVRNQSGSAYHSHLL